MDILDMIDLIQKRPGMYIGSNSITALFHYLNGYQAAECRNGLCGKGELFPLPFRYMHEYIGYRLKSHSTAGWCWLILNSCDGIEDIALQKFFGFYEEFKQVKMKKYWKAILSEDNIAWNNEMKGTYCCIGQTEQPNKKPIYRNPLAVYVMELSISVYILVVETESDVRPEYRFFTSCEKAKGCGLFPEGAGIYFSLIDTWEEYNTENISFHEKYIM